MFREPNPRKRIKNWSQDFLVILVMMNFLQDVKKFNVFRKEIDSLNNQTENWNLNQIKEITNKDYIKSLWSINKEKEKCLPRLKVLEDKMFQWMIYMDIQLHNHRFWDQVSILNLTFNLDRLKFLNNNQTVKDNLLETRLSKLLEMQSLTRLQRNNLLTKITANI